MKKILTHNGLFHPDEVLAIALIQVFDIENDVEITRGRGLDSAGFDIILDVNSKYESKSTHIYSGDFQSTVFHRGLEISGSFDHHQWSKEDEQFGRSSAGLIWSELTSEQGGMCETGPMPSKDILLYKEDYPSISALVAEVDAQDIGLERQAPNHFCGIISSFNDEDINAASQEAAFLDAVAFASRYVTNLKATDEFRKKQTSVALRADILEAAGLKVVVLAKDDVHCPAPLFIGRADIVLSWDAGQDCWTVNTVPLEKGKFGSQYLLTSVKDTGLEIFTHKGGFISKVRENEYKEIPINIGKGVIWVDTWNPFRG